MPFPPMIPCPGAVGEKVACEFVKAAKEYGIATPLFVIGLFGFNPLPLQFCEQGGAEPSSVPVSVTPTVLNATTPLSYDDPVLVAPPRKNAVAGTVVLLKGPPVCLNKWPNSIPLPALFALTKKPCVESIR